MEWEWSGGVGWVPVGEGAKRWVEVRDPLHPQKDPVKPPLGGEVGDLGWAKGPRLWPYDRGPTGKAHVRGSGVGGR